MSQSQPECTPVPVTAPGEGERRAQRGYTRQYGSSAAAIYAALERGNLEWVGVADRSAGIADDVVLGFPGRVIGHQFKTSQFPDPFRLKTLLTGANGLLLPLATAWQALKRAHPGKTVEIQLVTNDYPSTTDHLLDEVSDHSAAFIADFEAHPARSLADWRASQWEPLINELCTASGLNEQEFGQFLQSLKILWGVAANFAQTHRLTPDGARLAGEIALILPLLVADRRNKDRWTRAELLHELGWRDSTDVHHVHRFPVGAYVQRNPITESVLRAAIQRSTSGYVSLVGPPGAGKSTLLQYSLESEQDMFLVRYLAFVPNVAQGVGRGEANDFFNDITAQLKLTGLRGIRFRDQSHNERREQFTALLHEAGERFVQESVRTIIVIDGLDHVPREERPQRSFLAELPLPIAVPAGVLFVLGTQRVDLKDIPPAVQAQAGTSDRMITVAPLAREAVHRMADLLELDPSIDRDRIFNQSHGHPLVTRYIIEALRCADASTQNALLTGAMTFNGDIEEVYESAWRGIRNDDQACAVLDYLARAEGPMPLELLTKFIPEPAIEQALQATKHLLLDGRHGWSIFHNSFRLFILAQPRERLGRPDLTYSERMFNNLAALARSAPNDSPQRWLELRYLARAEEHESVLALATPTRFRQQLSERRSFSEILSDLRLAFASVKHSYDPLKVFQLLLIQDEMLRRFLAFEEAPSYVDALLCVGDLDGAAAFVEQVPAKGYEVVDALIAAGEFDRARILFEKIEPLQQLLSGMPRDNSLNDSKLMDWVQRVVHFRDAEQIIQAIQRLSKTSARQDLDTDKNGVENRIIALRMEAALAVVSTQNTEDPCEVGRRFDIEVDKFAMLMLKAGITAAERGAIDSALMRFRQAMAQENFLQTPNVWRRHAALIAAMSGNLELARDIFDGLRSPALTDVDREFNQGAFEHITRAIMEHAELAVLLNRQQATIPVSDRPALRPLQFHAQAIGQTLGRARLDPLSLTTGEVTRVARAALTYLNSFRPNNTDDHDALYRIALATPVLGKALIQSAFLCGEIEFNSTVGEFDRIFSGPDGNSARTNLRHEVAVEIYRCTGNTDAASLRLELLVDTLQEPTPEQQINRLASLAISFAQVGNVERAKSLLARLPDESLGYALAPKKDPQYSTWCKLLKLANEADPARRSDRVSLLLRQVSGMTLTEGKSASHRITGPLLKEASKCNAQTGWKAGKLFVDMGNIGWARLVDALMFGLVKRRPDLVLAATLTWCELSLPYYMEPYFNESDLGSFIDAAISSASQSDVRLVAEFLLTAIETESRAHERATLLDRLCRTAQPLGVWNQSMERVLERWKVESPPPRHSHTASPYDEILSLQDLKSKFAQDAEKGELNYNAPYAFCRLAPSADFWLAKDLFDRWESIQHSPRARFTLINLAIDSKQPEIARTLLEGYERTSGDSNTWTEWFSGYSLSYFNARHRLDGAQACKDAYDDFVGSLAAGREAVMHVLLDHDDIFKTLTDTPDWEGMWDALAEQLVTTREHVLGSVFDAGDVTSLSDEDLIVSAFVWAFSLPLDELHRHALCGALKLAATSSGKPIFVQLVRRLLGGTGNEPADGIQLLLLETNNSAASELTSEVLQLIDHADYAVAESAFVLARRWGLTPSRRTEELSSFYSFSLKSNDTFGHPQLVDETSRAMLVEDPFGWTHPLLDDEINLLTRNGITAEHIRYRCKMFIDQWGGLSSFGKEATKRFESELRRLEMKITYSRPHAAVAIRALRYVAGELRRGGLIPDEGTSPLLYRLGYPAPRPPMIQPVSRPIFVHRPVLDDTNWQTTEEDWLNGAAVDVFPLKTETDVVVAEVCEFHIRKFRNTFCMRRIRAPSLEIGSDSDFEGFDLLPRAIWLGRVYAMSNTPASTVACGLSVSKIPETPKYRLTVCPYWLNGLEWHTHPSNELILLDKDGNLVARIVWWRDGGPVDIGDDVIWGQGWYLIVTPAGRRQIEALAGLLDVRVHVSRSYVPESSHKTPEFRVISSRD